MKVYAIADDPEKVQADREAKARARARSAHAATQARAKRARPSFKDDSQEYDEENVTSIKSKFQSSGGGGGGNDDAYDSEDSFIARSDEGSPSKAEEDDVDEAEESISFGRKKRKGDFSDDEESS